MISKPQTFANDILMRSIKIIDIGYITIIYMIFSFFFALVTDEVMGKFDEKKESEKSIIQLTIEAIIIVWFYGVLIYIVRNLVQIVPFPLHGFQGFDHYRVKELGSGMVFTFTYVLFNSFLKNKLLYYYTSVVQKGFVK